MTQVELETRTILHEDPLLLVVGPAAAHLEPNVLQTRRLCHLPVQAGAGLWGLFGHIDDEVANLAEEIVLVRVPVAAGLVVRVGIDDGDA